MICPLDGAWVTVPARTYPFGSLETLRKANCARRDVRFGSLADKAAIVPHVCFTSISDR